MKKHSIVRISLLLVFLLGIVWQLPAPAVLAQDEEPTDPPADTPTVTPTLPAEVTRPLVVIESYGTGNVDAGKTFDLEIILKNKGAERASNLIAVFQSTDFFPLDTGGVTAKGELNPGKSYKITQPMIAGKELAAGSVSTVTVALSYVGQSGQAFSETFTITIGVRQSVWSGGAALPTATPTAQPRPQVVVSSYQVDVDPLQPGTVFNLSLEVRNLGNSAAKAVTMVIGGSGAGVDLSGGTPQPGGISGGSSELTNFAPLGSSNLFYLGDIPTGAVYNAVQQLIVNVTTNPGAYPLKLSFVYVDEQGNHILDDQGITLLVYSLPQVEVGYYRDPGVFFAGQPNQLPLQVTNLGRTTTVLGNLKVSAENAEVTNNTSLVGSLEPGGYFTMDAMVVPSQPGTLEMLVNINYTDNFNQSRTLTETLSIEVQEGGPAMGPGMPGEGMEGMQDPMYVEGVMPVEGMGGMPSGPETFWQKVLRVLKGLVGLNSAQEQPGPEMPIMEGPMGPEGVQIAPMQ